MSDPRIAAAIAMTAGVAPAPLIMLPAAPGTHGISLPGVPIADAASGNDSVAPSALLATVEGDIGAKKKEGKRGKSNKGLKYQVQERNFWFQLCRMFDDNRPKYSNKQAMFLSHSDSGTFVENSNKFRNKMSRWYRKYKAGTLTADEPGRKRNRPGEYEDVGERLIAHLNQIEKTMGVGLSWEQMRHKARDISIELGRDDTFKASSGWLHNVLRKANKLSSTPMASRSSSLSSKAGSKLAPMTPIQALHHLSELRRYCLESNCVPALDACDDMDLMLRAHNAGSATKIMSSSKKAEKGKVTREIVEAEGNKGRSQEGFMAQPTGAGGALGTALRLPQLSLPNMLAAAARATAMMAPNGTPTGAMVIPTTLAATRRQPPSNTRRQQLRPTAATMTMRQSPQIRETATAMMQYPPQTAATMTMRQHQAPTAATIHTMMTMQPPPTAAAIDAILAAAAASQHASV